MIPAPMEARAELMLASAVSIAVTAAAAEAALETAKEAVARPVVVSVAVSVTETVSVPAAPTTKDFVSVVAITVEPFHFVLLAMLLICVSKAWNSVSK